MWNDWSDLFAKVILKRLSQDSLADVFRYHGCHFGVKLVLNKRGYEKSFYCKREDSNQSSNL